MQGHCSLYAGLQSHFSKQSSLGPGPAPACIACSFLPSLPPCLCQSSLKAPASPTPSGSRTEASSNPGHLHGVRLGRTRETGGAKPHHEGGAAPRLRSRKGTRREEGDDVPGVAGKESARSGRGGGVEGRGNRECGGGGRSWGKAGGAGRAARGVAPRGRGEGPSRRAGVESRGGDCETGRGA